ncbi:E3 ubiquitin-protein ligase TRAIP-like isoform X2 [Hyperolius riggenbachi]|uniref:E3 ubiquitin-protein ligase TRAIP-like isoform X2 n=1 Tax=Hyperolius riggenbachi TaxID=752182 RepID=UPI0035A27720
MPIRALCTICSDYFDHQHDVAAIHCGHTFHYQCLQQWFSSAPNRTCPQCRIQVSNRQIINKLFFDVGLEEETTLDAESLKNEVDRVKASLHIKEKEKRECQTLVDSLRDMLDVRNVTIECLEKKIGDLEMLCTSLKKQMKFFDLQQIEAETAKEEARKLRNKLRSLEREYENLKEARRSTTEMTEKLKKELFSSTHKAQKTELELQKVREELNASQKELHNADKEIMSLKKKVEFLQKTLSTPNATNEAISRLIFESPAPLGMERPKLRPPMLGNDVNLDITFDIDTPEPNLPKSVTAPFKRLKLDQSVSPVKSQAKNTLLESKGLKTYEEDEPVLPSFIKNSLLRKKPIGSMLSAHHNTGVVRTGFDGLGGRTKFIQPSSMSDIRPLPPKLKRKKVSRPPATSTSTLNQPRLEDFLK